MLSWVSASKCSRDVMETVKAFPSPSFPSLSPCVCRVARHGESETSGCARSEKRDCDWTAQRCPWIRAFLEVSVAELVTIEIQRAKRWPSGSRLSTGALSLDANQYFFGQGQLCALVKTVR